jgi:hypothetical protein
MSHTIVLTKVMQTEIELTDEEYDEYVHDLFGLFDDYGCSEMETVERIIEEV